MTTVTTITAMKALNPASSPEIYVAGYYNPGDLGGGEFYYDSGSSATPNEGTIFASTYTGTGRWFRVLNGTRVNVRWFGAYGNNSNDDTAAFQAAIDYCGTIGVGLYLSMGTYIVSAANAGLPCLKIHDNGFFMEGDGFDSEIKGANSTPNQALIKIQANSGQIQNITVRNIRCNGNQANQSGSWHNFGMLTLADPSNSTPLNITLSGLYCHDAYCGDGTESGGICILGDDPNFNYTEYPTQNVIVDGCFCWNNGSGWGIATVAASGVIISNNVCWGNGTQGISLWNTQDSIVEGNRCYDNVSIGINTEICDKITISNNDIDTTQFAGIRLYNSVDITVVGNSCTSNTSDYRFFALGLESGAGYVSGSYKQRPCRNVQVSSNILKCVGSDGTVVKVQTYGGGYSDNISIVMNDNIINNSVTFKGIEIVATDFTFANNKIIGTASLTSSGGFVTLDSNDIIYATANSAFNLVTINTATDVVVKGNILRGGSYAAAAIALTSSYSHIIVFDNIYQSFSSFISGGSPTVRDNLAW